MFGPVALQGRAFLQRLHAMMIQTQEPQIPGCVGPAVRMGDDVIHVEEMTWPYLVAHPASRDAAPVKKQGA